MNTKPSENLQEEEIDIKRYLIAILYNWPWFIVSVFLALIVVYFVNRYASPTYEADTTLIVKTSKTGATDIVEELGWNSSEVTLENEIAYIKSYSYAKTVLKDLKFDISYFKKGDVLEHELYKNSPFYVEYDSLLCKRGLPIEIHLLDSLKYSLKYEKGDTYVQKECFFGQKYVDDNFSFSLYKKNYEHTFNPNDQYSFVINNIENLALSYSLSLKVASTAAPSVLKISISGKVQSKLIDYVNRIAQLYIDNDLDEKNKVYENTIKFIDSQLEEIVDSLSMAESNIELFRKSNKIISLGREGGALFGRLQTYEEKESALNLRMKYYDYLFDYIEGEQRFQDVVAPSVIGISDALLNKLVSKLVGLNEELSILEFRSSKENPNIALLKLKIANTRNALMENLKNVKKGADIELDDVRSKIAEVELEISKIPTTERKMVNIERKYKLSNSIYTFLLQKRAEAGIAKASNVSNASVIDEAIPVRVVMLPSKNKKILITGILIAIVIPVLLIVLLVLFDDKLNEIKEIETVAKMPIAGLIPHSNKEANLVVLEHPQAQISEAYRSVRSNLSFLLPKDKFVIAVCSTISGEGKTFNALNLASIYSVSGKKTVLVGLDLRKPKLHYKFGLDNAKGVTTVLIGKDKWRDCVSNVHKNFDFLPSGPLSPNPAELMESDATYELIKELQEVYDVVIIDTPPLAIISDAMLLQTKVDLTVYVVRQKYSKKSVVRFANDLFQEKKLNNPALLVNDVDIKMRYAYTYGRYGKGYGSYGDRYYGKYGSYYQEEKKSMNIFKRLFVRP